MKWRVGEVTITKIVELEATGGSRFILPQATYEAVLPIGWLRPHFADERGFGSRFSLKHQFTNSAP